MKNNIEISELRELSTETSHEMRLKISDEFLNKLGDFAEELLIEELVKKIIDTKFNDITNQLDYSDITSKVQQSIINTLTIKELNKTLNLNNESEA